MSARSGFGGGLAGGLLCAVLKGILGTIGAFLVMAVLIIICAVIITERSFVKAVKKHSDAAYQYAKEDMDRRRELHAERQEERRRRREEQVSGVNLSSTDLSAYASGDEDFEDELLSRPEPDFREDSTAGADDSIRRDPALAEGRMNSRILVLSIQKSRKWFPREQTYLQAAFLFRRNIRMRMIRFPLMWMGKCRSFRHRVLQQTAFVGLRRQGMYFLTAQQDRQRGWICSSRKRFICRRQEKHLRNQLHMIRSTSGGTGSGTGVKTLSGQ